MPTYEYACEACENTWEQEQRITEAAIRDCPKCGQPKARRLISGSRFVLKGGGWYADGYGSSSKSATKSESKSDSSSSDKKADSGSGSSDTKSSTETKATAAAE